MSILGGLGDAIRNTFGGWFGVQPTASRKYTQEWITKYQEGGVDYANQWAQSNPYVGSVTKIKLSKLTNSNASSSSSGSSIIFLIGGFILFLVVMRK